MTPRPLAVLAGSDARIFDLVAQVAAIVERHNLGTAADVVRIAMAHLPHGHVHEREAAAQRRRAEAAEAEVQRLREKATQHRARIAELETRPKVWAPAGVTHRRVAYLTQLQIDILEQACRGRALIDIAADMGMTRTAVQSHIGRCADAMEADSPLHALSLVNRNVIEIRVKSRRAA